MTSVRNRSILVLLALTVVALGCSGGGGASPTVPEALPEGESGEFSGQKKGGQGNAKDPSEYELDVGGLVPGTFDNFARTGKLSIARRIDCGLKVPNNPGLPLCPANFPSSDDVIAFLDDRFAGEGLAACLTEIIAFNQIIVLQPSNPDPDTFEIVIDFTADTAGGNRNALHSYVSEISRAPGETASFPPVNVLEAFDMMTDADDQVELVPGRKRNSCPGGPVLANDGATATVTKLPS